MHLHERYPNMILLPGCPFFKQIKVIHTVEIVKLQLADTNN